MSSSSEGKSENNSKSLINDNKHFKRKTIDEQDEPYMTNELYINDETSRAQSRYKEVSLLNKEFNDTNENEKDELNNIINKDKFIHNDNFFNNIKNLKKYQQYEPYTDKIAQTVESPITQDQKKQLALLNKKNPACPKPLKFITRKELNKENIPQKKIQTDEDKTTKNDILKDNNVSQEQNENKDMMELKIFVESKENTNEIKVIPKKNEYKFFQKETQNIQNHDITYIQSLNDKSFKQVNEKLINNNPRVKTTIENPKKSNNDYHPKITSYNDATKIINSKSKESAQPNCVQQSNSINSYKENNTTHYVIEKKNCTQFIQQGYSKNDFFPESENNVSIKKRSNFCDNSHLFNDVDRNIKNCGSSTFGSNHIGAANSNNFDDIYQNKKNQKILTTNSNTKNKNENVCYVTSKDDYATRERCYIYNKKSYEDFEKTEKDTSSINFIKEKWQEKKVEINLDNALHKKDLQNANNIEICKDPPFYKKTTKINEHTQVDDINEMPNSKKTEKIEIIVKPKVIEVKDMVEEIETKSPYIDKYDDIPCKGSNSYDDNMFNNREISVNHSKTNKSMETTNPIKKKTVKISSNHLYDINSNISSMNSNNCTINSNNNNTYNRMNENNKKNLGDTYNSNSTEKSKTIGVSNKTISSTNKQINSTPKKKATPSVTSKIKADKVTYITYEELIDFPYSINSDHMSEIVINIIEKSKDHEWTKQIEDLLNLRKILKYHAKVFFEEQTKDLRRMIRAVVELINSPRSCVSKNALLCLAEFYNSGKKKTDCTIDDVLLPCLKKAHQTSVDFISSAANNALLAICNACSETKLILYLIKQITSKQKTYNLLCLRCLIAVLIKIDEHIIKFKESDKLVETIFECTAAGSAELKCTARVALVVLDNVYPIRKLCSKHVSETNLKKIDAIIDKTSENEIDLVLGKIAVC